MTLMETAQLLGNFGEFFGAVAVVATLAYLAVQIRQNKDATRASTHHEISVGLVEVRSGPQILNNDVRCSRLAEGGNRHGET